MEEPMTRRLYIRLSKEDLERLGKLAEREARHRSDQAAVLLSRALQEAAGSDDPMTAERWARIHLTRPWEHPEPPDLPRVQVIKADDVIRLCWGVAPLVAIPIRGGWVTLQLDFLE